MGLMKAAGFLNTCDLVISGISKTLLLRLFQRSYSIMKSFLLVAVSTALSQAVAGTASGARHQGPDFTPNHRFSSRVPAKSSKQPVIPKLKTTPEILGLVNDPALDRDSCGSSNFGDRTLWTCRDTQLFYPNGSVIVPSLITSTASWTNYASDGGPMLENLSSDADKLNTTVLKQYGKNAVDQAFFPVDPAYFCSPPSGGCSDGTRFALCKSSLESKKAVR